MDSSSSPKAACPRCGTPLPPNAPEGLCPRCLGALNLTADTAFTNPDEEHKAPPTPEEIAPHFPQLEILECLGRGGMGVVYKARQKALNRTVALKLLAPEREKDAHFAERFGHEAQALAQLAHPNIVTVHDFGQSNGYFYLLMEFVDGVNLRELLRSRRLTPEEALAIVPPLCEALQYAHERGIVHRDIKPENLLLSKEGRIKVVDFGIAKMLGATAQAAEEKAAGTPGYMAPEQKKTPNHVDSRADIFSLGVVFYEMLTGELPAQKLVAPSRKVAVDVRIDEVVLRALEKSPDLRWQTAAEMRTGVEEAAASPRAASAPSEGTTSKPGSRLLLIAMIAIVAIFCGLLSRALFGHFRYGWLIASLIAFALMIIFGLLTKEWQTKLTRHAALLLLGAVLAVPILGLGPLYLVLREYDGPRETLASLEPPPLQAQPSINPIQPTLGVGKPTIAPPPTALPAPGSPARKTPPQVSPSAGQPSAAIPASGTSVPPAAPEPGIQQPGVSDPQSRFPVLDEIPILAPLFTKPPDPGSSPAAQTAANLLVITDGDVLHPNLPLTTGAEALRKREEARKSLEELEQTLRVLQKRLIEGTISSADYRNAELGVEAMRATVKALEENPNTVTLPLKENPPPASSPASTTAPRRETTDYAANPAGIGIGVVLKEENGRIIIDRILPDSPAAEDGSLKPGHEIRSIGDSGDQLTEIAGRKMGDVVARLRGKEGAQLSLFVVREGVGTIVTLIRRHVPAMAFGSEPSKAETSQPPVPLNRPPPARTRWELRRFADASVSAMFPLLSTPSEPPMIVAAGGQKLRAFRADREGGEITWETNLDATICSAPARGGKIGRIFFGTADNQFHALDAHGRERWKFAAGGKVVTQSVVTDDVMVIFGCDDGQVYGLNAETGSIKWKFGAFASATSAPGIAAGLLIVGSTDGLVYALEPQTGEKKWSYKATASIHAPIVGAGELIYLATKAGEIVALDSKTGDTRWTNSFGGSAEAAMALGKENLFVVEGGQVTAISLQTGSQLWQTPAEEYVGAPLLAENTLVVARRSGTVRRLDFAGSIREEWKASKKEGQSAASFTFGPVTGGGALWLADDEGGMWRLAPVVSKSDSK